MDANTAKSIFEAPEVRPLVIMRLVPPPVTTRPPLVSSPVLTTRVAASATNDGPLIAILDRPLGRGESASVGFARKENELGAEFARLSVLESREIHSRLTINASNDVLATKFSRLTVDRRHRLLNFLADARRREALGVRGGR